MQDQNIFLYSILYIVQEELVLNWELEWYNTDYNYRTIESLQTLKDNVKLNKQLSLDSRLRTFRSSKISF